MTLGEFLEVPVCPSFLSSRQHTLAPSGVVPMCKTLLLLTGPLCCSTQIAWGGFPLHDEQLPLLLRWVGIMEGHLLSAVARVNE